MSDIFEKHYGDYLEKLAGVDFGKCGDILGGRLTNDSIEIPLFDRIYFIKHDGITDADGRQPPYADAVLLCRYLFMCPDAVPPAGGWVAYRDLKDSGPLTVYFANDVERALTGCFTGRIADLERACVALGGRPAAMNTAHDLSMRFDALPRVPLLLLFNDADDEFPAACSVLFEHRAERFLDAECLAMLGRGLFNGLKALPVR